MTHLIWQPSYPFYDSRHEAYDEAKEYYLFVCENVRGWDWEVSKVLDNGTSELIVSADGNDNYALSIEEAKEKAEWALHNLKHAA